MTVVGPASQHSPPQTLHQQVAGQSVMIKTLDLHHAGAHRSLPARVFGISPLHETSRSWYSGTLGELEVGRQLARLGPDLTNAFPGLQKQVNRAAAVRMLWRLLRFVVIVAALIYFAKP